LSDIQVAVCLRGSIPSAACTPNKPLKKDKYYIYLTVDVMFTYLVNLSFRCELQISVSVSLNLLSQQII